MKPKRANTQKQLLSPRLNHRTKESNTDTYRDEASTKKRLTQTHTELQNRKETKERQTKTENRNRETHLNTMLQAIKLPAGVSDLDASLTDMHRDALSHDGFGREARPNGGLREMEGVEVVCEDGLPLPSRERKSEQSELHLYILSPPRVTIP